MSQTLNQNKLNSIQSHQLTHQEILDIKDKQSHELEIETMKGNTPEGQDEKCTYTFPVHEKHLLHAEIEIKEFDKSTGKKKSVPRHQPFYPMEFDAMVNNKVFIGQSVTVLHDPRREKKDVVTSENDTTKKDAGAGELNEDKRDIKDIISAVKTYFPLDPVRNNVKTLSGMYLSLYKEQPDESLTKAQLVEQIEQRVAFLEEEFASAQ